MEQIGIVLLVRTLVPMLAMKRRIISFSMKDN
jgi:hypothetical protein